MTVKQHAHLHAQIGNYRLFLEHRTLRCRNPAVRITRRATNVTLPVDLIMQARALRLNISQACEQGLKAELARSQGAQWLAENREALASSNHYVDRNGLPLSEFRQF
jgi:antitoxin CcdA